LISDYLALVGDAADGFPGIVGCGPKTAASLLNRYGPIEDFPADVLKGKKTEALLFKDLATLRTNAPLFENVDELRWTGATKSFPAVAEKIQEPRLAVRVQELQRKLEAK
jgi:5'-3' exonuclease